MKVAALIIGIDGWERYTAPLVLGLMTHAPNCQVVVIDNGSREPYPQMPDVHRTPRLCYAAAINQAAAWAPEADYLIALSNDVECTGPFEHMLADLGDCVFGPEVCEVRGQVFVMGWFVGASRVVWQAVGGWDENYVVSSWEDVDFSQAVRRAGFRLAKEALPFRHLDQRQRFGLPEFAGTHERNQAYFGQKWGVW